MKSRWFIVALALLAGAGTKVCSSAAAGATSALQYLEATEQVRIQSPREEVLYQYNDARQGFISPRGDWVAWDHKAGNWLALFKSGVQQRYDAGGRLIWEQAAKPAAATTRTSRSGYDPALDVADTSNAGGAGAQKAWEYLNTRAEVSDGMAAPGSGDDGGVPVPQESVGGAGAAKDKAMRDQWTQQPGAHQNDPDAAMETGEVVDPLEKLQDTMEQVATMASGVADTIQQADKLQDDIKNFGKGGSAAGDDALGGDGLYPAGGAASAPANGAGANASGVPMDTAQGQGLPTGTSLAPYPNQPTSRIPPQYGRPPAWAPTQGTTLVNDQHVGGTITTSYPDAFPTTANQREQGE